MLKESVTYKPHFADKEVTDTLYFNLSKAVLSENLNLLKDFEVLKEMFSEKHDLSIDEIDSILRFIKKLMVISYGLRLDDGGFDQSEAVWLKFTQSAAYSAFLFSLFEDPNRANEFMIGIFPDDLIASAKEQLKFDPNAIKSVELPSESTKVVIKEPKDMSREELLEVMKTRSAALQV